MVMLRAFTGSWAPRGLSCAFPMHEAVAREIKLGMPSSATRTDEDIARAAMNHVNWNYSVPSTVNEIENALRRTAENGAKHVTVETAEGKMTLRGYVHSWAQREQAENAAWAAPGVTRAEDLITVS